MVGPKIINLFLHEYDFPIANEFEPYIDDMVLHYHKKLDRKKQQGNVIYQNEKLKYLAQEQYYNIIKENYITSPPLLPLELYIYVQNSKQNIELWHNHAVTSSISGVFYLNIPKDGGSIKFFIDGEEVYYYPKPNKILLFPSWLYHTPTPQKEDKWRVCVNLEFYCKNTPLVKQPMYLLGQNMNLKW